MKRILQKMKVVVVMLALLRFVVRFYWYILGAIALLGVAIIWPTASVQSAVIYLLIVLLLGLALQGVLRFLLNIAETYAGVRKAMDEMQGQLFFEEPFGQERESHGRIVEGSVVKVEEEKPEEAAQKQEQRKPEEGSR